MPYFYRTFFLFLLLGFAFLAPRVSLCTRTRARCPTTLLFHRAVGKVLTLTTKYKHNNE